MIRRYEEEAAIIEDIALKGYSVIDLSERLDDCRVLMSWEDVFRRAFLLPVEVKKEGGVYSGSTDGLAVGYRQDESREFFETRLASSDGGDAICSPDLPLPEYSSTVFSLCNLLG
jgi:hypothetical protein